MSSQTTNIRLTKQDGNEYADGDILNSNLDIIDDEIGKRGKTVNGIAADDNGNYQLNEVPFARQIVTNDLQQSSAEFIERTTGGSISIGTGEAKLVSILGRSVHTGIVEESITMTVNVVAREEGEEITATLDRDTFVAYVSGSQTITLEYTDAWSANPTLYGITVSGEPVEGDTIVIVYVEASRGLISNSTPSKFISTGWNLYNHSKGHARVLKYSDAYGFMVGGTYSTIKFSATLDGTKTTITPVNGKFTIPSDGYVWITGGNATSTYIIMTWSDWTSGYSGTFQAYTESVINLATIVTNFPYGMMSVGGTADEIDLSTGIVTSRIERMAYSAANVEAAVASGRAWDADENYIYIVREEAITYSTSVSGDYSADDHGMEIVEGSAVPVFMQTLYGDNLVDKLRTDVVTKSADLVNNANQTASGKALDARMGKTLNDRIYNIRSYSDKGTISTLADLESMLDAELNSMDASTRKTFYFQCGAYFSCFINGVGYYTELRKTSGTNYASVDFRGQGGTRYIIGGRTVSGWTFSRVESTGQNLAIVTYDDVAPSAIKQGEYVIWRGFLHTAKSQIAVGDTLSTSNLTSVPLGGFNSLLDKINTVNSNLNGYVYGGLLASGTDMNGVVEPGVYFLAANYTYANTPASLSNLIVEKGYQSGNAILQIGLSTGQIWYRYRTSATNWNSWKLITQSGGWVENGTSIDDVLSPGVYALSSANTYGGTLPPGVNSGTLEVFSPSLFGVYASQRLTTFDGSHVYYRFRGASSGSVWNSWVTQI